MECKISEYSKNVLKELYDNCSEQCNDKSASLLVKLLNKKNNDRAEILKKAAIKTEYVDSQTKEELESNGLVYGIKNTTLICITAKGILTYEALNSEDYLDIFCNEMQTKYFDLFSTTSMSARNRICILDMIALRCFSQEACVDLRIDANTCDHWWNSMNDCSDFLISLETIKEKDSLRYYSSESGIENAASDVIRHSDRLPRITDGIFSKSKKNQYWLNVLMKDGEPNLDQLAFLIKQTIPNLSRDNVVECYEFCNDLCLKYGFLIESSIKNSKYLGCEYDDYIKRAFEIAATLNVN